MKKVLGIIAEYNPFHNGHLYHLNESKKITGADFTVAVIGGNFTQRGDTSIVDKWTKAKMAILNGVDLVIELPTVYSISSAENFAKGAVSLLDSLGIVDYISFGSECSDICKLKNISSVLVNEPDSFKESLGVFLKEGHSFPLARQKAIESHFNGDSSYSDIISSPNNILGIEYLKALEAISSNIVPVCITRNQTNYNDTLCLENIASATAIRSSIESNDFSSIQTVIPSTSFSILDEMNENFVTSLSCFEKEILYKFRTMSLGSIANLPDVSEGLEFLFKSSSLSFNTLSTFLDGVKSKRYTFTRLQRICLYALLDISKDDIDISTSTIPYVRVLGFNNNGQTLLSSIKEKNPEISLVVSSKKFVDSNYDDNTAYKMMFNKDILATNVYTLARATSFNGNVDFTNNAFICK